PAVEAVVEPAARDVEHEGEGGAVDVGVEGREARSDELPVALQHERRGASVAILNWGDHLPPCAKGVVEAPVSVVAHEGEGRVEDVGVGVRGARSDELPVALQYERRGHSVAKLNWGDHLPPCAKGAVEAPVSVVAREGEGRVEDVGVGVRGARSDELPVALQYERRGHSVAKLNWGDHLPPCAKGAVEAPVSVVARE